LSATLKELRQGLGRDLHELYVGQIVTATTTSFTDPSLIDWRGAGDQKLGSAWVRISSGNQAGTTRRVGSYDDEVGRVIVTREWTPPAGDDEYELHVLLSPDDIDHCINRTLRRCYQRGWEELIPAAGQRQYPLVFSWMRDPHQIRRVYWREGEMDQQRFYPFRWWWVQDNAGEYTLHVRPTTVASTTTIMLDVVRPYEELTDDADTTDCPEEWVKAGAEMEVYRLLSHRDPARDATRWKQLQMEAAQRFARLTRAYSPRRQVRVQLPDSVLRNLSSDIAR